MSQLFIESHSTKQIEDAVDWGLETTPEVLIATLEAPSAVNKENVEEFARRVRCPVLVIHGDEVPSFPMREVPGWPNLQAGRWRPSRAADTGPRIATR